MPLPYKNRPLKTLRTLLKTMSYNSLMNSKKLLKFTKVCYSEFVK